MLTAMGVSLSSRLIVAIMVMLLLLVAAHADCDVPPNGIPENAIVPIDPWHEREAFAKSGIALGGFYAAEVFGNPSGGIRQGTIYDGVLELYVDADLNRIGLWKGLCFHANGYQIHGQSFTIENAGSLVTVSNLEATPATKLYELWLEQGMFHERVSVRIGQIAADGEFMVIKGADYFLDGTWGWPSLLAADLPSGGPAYPLATPGVHVAVTPTDNLALLIGVYNGDPAGPSCQGDPQVCDKNGLEFNLEVPALLMMEGTYKYDQNRLAGTVRVGAWNHFGTFEHQRVDIGGNLIADTRFPGKPLRKDHGGYAMIDQLLLRVPGSEDPKGVGVFARVIGAPADRNLVDFYADGGVIVSGMIAKRPDDSLAIGFAYTAISDQVHAFDMDSGLAVARSYEALLEICYTMQVATGWTLQPDFQYIRQPGGNVPDENGIGTIQDAIVFGARTTVSF